ncbi:hypothetical protein ABZ403_30395 [Micromonospora zamorensis]|uniref:hypothetical protein n=1 Tax=Micromonospora zamorensis TaxID=709883 RepID=UPI0033F9D956
MATLAASGAVGTSLAALAAGNWALYKRILGQDLLAIHDLIAVAEAVWPGTLRTQTMRIDVENGHGPARGTILRDRRRYHDGPAAGREVEVAVGLRTASLHDHVLAQFAAAHTPEQNRAEETWKLSRPDPPLPSTPPSAMAKSGE